MIGVGYDEYIKVSKVIEQNVTYVFLTEARHIQAVSSFTSKVFIACFRSFVSYRGQHKFFQVMLQFFKDKHTA